MNKHAQHTPSCCHPSDASAPDDAGASCHSAKSRFDWLLWGSGSIVAVAWLAAAVFPTNVPSPAVGAFTASVYTLINTMWWGVVLGAVMVGLLGKIPREFVMSALGNRGGIAGMARATAAGVLLDLCSHGILMVGSKLYERGASIGQVMAFLIASPWNSFSLTLVLIALIGLPWTLAFIVLSMAIAISTGLLFESLVTRGFLPGNPQQVALPDGFKFWPAARAGLSATRFNAKFFGDVARDGIKDSRMVLRWLLFGVVLAAAIRTLMPTDMFASWFGPTLAGLGLTILAATIIEVCSEGSAPIAADLLTRAASPGNSFAFLMTGVSTDYTEIMVMRDTTQSWRIALMLPALTVPQVIAVALMINHLT